MDAFYHIFPFILRRQKLAGYPVIFCWREKQVLQDGGDENRWVEWRLWVGELGILVPSFSGHDVKCSVQGLPVPNVNIWGLGV